MKKLFIKQLLLLITTFSLSSAVFADSQKNAWTQCGIGAMIFDETPWAAVSSNIIWDLGITGSSSSSSSPSQCSGKVASAAKFIHQNIAILEEETTIGEGTHLVAVLNILGCEKNSQSSIIKRMRSHLKTQLQSPASSERANTKRAEQYFYDLSDEVEYNFSNNCQSA